MTNKGSSLVWEHGIFIWILLYFRRARQRPLVDEDIAIALHDGADSEDGLDYDDDSLQDPDFVPELETFEDETAELDIDMDSIIETLEDDQESPSTSAETASSNASIPQPSRDQSNQCNRTQTNKKPAKLKLRWKKENLQVNAEQLTFTGNKTLGPDLMDLDTPIQFFLYLFVIELIKKISEETNLYQVQNDPNSTFRVSEMDIRQFIGVVLVVYQVLDSND